MTVETIEFEGYQHRPAVNVSNGEGFGMVVFGAGHLIELTELDESRSSSPAVDTNNQTPLAV